MVLRHWSLGALALALAGGLAAACGDDDGGSELTDPIPTALAGDWEATPECRPPCAFTAIPLANPADSVSLLGLSASVEISISTGGGFVLRVQLPEGGMLPLAGTARTTGNTIYVTGPTGAVDTATYALANDLLTLEYQNAISVPGLDLDEDGQPDRARVRAVLRRK
jgi:hypothetical protein